MAVITPVSISNAPSAARELASNVAVSHHRRLNAARREAVSADTETAVDSATRGKDRNRRRQSETTDVLHTDFVNVMFLASNTENNGPSGTAIANSHNYDIQTRSLTAATTQAREGLAAIRSDMRNLQPSTDSAQMMVETGIPGAAGKPALPENPAFAATTIPHSVVPAAGSMPEVEDSGETVAYSMTPSLSITPSLSTASTLMEGDSEVATSEVVGSSAVADLIMDVVEDVNMADIASQRSAAANPPDDWQLHDMQLISNADKMRFEGAVDNTAGFPQALQPVSVSLVTSQAEGNVSETRMPLSNQISNAVLRQFQNEAARQESSLTLRLDPPELGELVIHLSRSADGIVVRVTAREPVTMDMLMARGDEIQDRLRGQDVDISDIEFVRAELSDNGFRGQDGQRYAELMQPNGRSGRRIRRTASNTDPPVVTEGSGLKINVGLNGFGFRA